MKYLLLLVFLGVVWWVWKKRAAEPLPPAGKPEKQAEKMVACAHCGLLLPESDSLSGGADHYCCEAHRQAGSTGRR